MERHDGDSAVNMADAAHGMGIRFACRDRRLSSTTMAVLSRASTTPTSSQGAGRISTKWGGVALAWLALAECASARNPPALLDSAWDKTMKVERSGSAKVLELVNIDTTDCIDRGHASIKVTRPPRLGTLEVRQSHVITEVGPCAGRFLPTLYVTYRAGLDAGVDEIRFTVIGTGRIQVEPLQVQLRMTVSASGRP